MLEGGQSQVQPSRLRPADPAFRTGGGLLQQRKVERRRLIAIALWTAALVSGWWAGHAQRSAPVSASLPAPVSRAPREWTDAERLKRVVELLGRHGHGAVGDWMEIDGHLAAVSLETLQKFYDRKVDAMTPDPFDGKREADYLEKRQQDEVHRLAFEAWCRRDPFDFINRHPDPPVDQMDFALTQAVIKDPHRTMRYVEQAREELGYNIAAFFRTLAEHYPDLALQAARAWPEQMVDWIAVGCTQEIRASAQRWEWAEMVHYRRKEKGEDAVRRILELIAKDEPDFLRGRAGQGVLVVYPDMLPGESAPSPLPPPRDPLIGDALPALKDGLLPENPNPGPHEGPTIVPGRQWERWFSRDPAAAMAWLDTIKRPGQREAMLDEIVSAAVRTDLQSLDQLLPRLTNPDEHKSAIGVAVAILETEESFAALQRFVNRYPGALEEVYDPAILNP